LLPHGTYFIRQFLVLVLFVGYCFGEIMFNWDSYVYQKDVLCFLIHKSYVRSITRYCFVRKIAAIIIIIIIIIISFIQGIFTYIPETKYVPREYNVAAILLLLFIIIIIIIIIIITIIIIISFMQGIYTYIPETNCVPRE